MKLSHIKQAAHNLVPAIAIGLAIFGAAMGLFTLIWGWPRFVADFIPLDASRVGPNLVASVVTVVLVVAHNEARAVQLAEEHHKSIRQATKEAIENALHPAEAAEQAVADDLAAPTPLAKP